jgi:GNAT superfamily N-acetyltransferase
MESKLLFRLATKNDLPYIVKMLLDDPLGATREEFSGTVSDNYIQAFDIINADSNQELTVVESAGAIVATFHLSFTQYLTHHGGRRAQVEAVRTHAAFRGQGIGKKVFDYIINRAKENGCILLQLTTDKKRPNALRFYESIGFVATHEGMKLSVQ